SPEARAPLTTQGSGVAVTPDESTIIVADEDHEALFVAPADLGPAAVRVVSMPGPPAQVVALDGLVFVTVRTLPTDAGREARAAVRGPAPTPEGARTLSETKVIVPAGAAKSATPAAPSGPLPSAAPPSSADLAKKYAASSKPSAAPPPPTPKRGTPPRFYDARAVRESKGGLLVAMRMDATQGLVEIGRVELAPDAWGLTLTPDRKRAVVTSAWSAEVAIIDVTDPAKMAVVTKQSVAREPRGIAITPDGKTAFVSHLVGTALTRIDDVGGDPKIAAQPLPAAPSRTIPGVETSASLAYSLVLSPEGDTLYVPRHAIGADGVEAWWGTPTVDTMDVGTGQPLQPAREPRSPSAEIESGRVAPAAAWMAHTDLPPAVSDKLVQPRASVFRRSTRTLLVASEGFDAVTELGTLVADPAMDLRAVYNLGKDYDTFGAYVERGGAPSALALTRDENALLVFCRSTFDVARIDLVSGQVTWLHLADDGLPIDAAYGRRLYYNASATTVSGGLACSACHPEGREDGYVWREGPVAISDDELPHRFVANRQILKFPIFRDPDAEKPPLYARQTPMIAGRVRADGPYDWHGHAKDLLDRLIDGFHLHRAGWSSSDADKSIGQHVAKIDYLADFLRSGLLPPPTLARELTDVEKQGKAVFEGAKAKCSQCHVPATGFTDRKVVPLEPLPTRPGFDKEEDHAFKTPTLDYIGGTAPYFHDGSAATLEDLLRTNGQRMGDTSQLTPDELTALAAYLRTL
ncbi:MAG TPA: hypothetical protein VL400_13615, partial [Polyangiaceae bacterium]|nr:hypothetical protein [Polyangiaceae bacterium]